MLIRVSTAGGSAPRRWRESLLFRASTWPEPNGSTVIARLVCPSREQALQYILAYASSSMLLFRRSETSRKPARLARAWALMHLDPGASTRGAGTRRTKQGVGTGVDGLVRNCHGCELIVNALCLVRNLVGERHDVAGHSLRCPNNTAYCCLHRAGHGAFHRGCHALDGVDHRACCASHRIGSRRQGADGRPHNPLGATDSVRHDAGQSTSQAAPKPPCGLVSGVGDVSAVADCVVPCGGRFAARHCGTSVI